MHIISPLKCCRPSLPFCCRLFCSFLPLNTGKLARLLRDMGPNRTEDAEEAYRLWMERLQTAVTGQLPPGSDQDLAECINEYIDVLEAQVSRTVP